MLKLNKYKEFKIYIIIAGFIFAIIKAIGYGKDKEQLKNYKENEKAKIKSKKSLKKILNDSSYNARKWLYNKKNRRSK